MNNAPAGAMMRNYKGMPMWTWMAGMAAVAGGMYYYFWYIPAGQKQLVAMKDEADKVKYPERRNRDIDAGKTGR